jgi:DnaB-like helicase N terminal domain/AAA domain
MTRPPSADVVAATLPHSLDAERSILGAVLLDNQALLPAVERLRAEDFFLPQHRHIFSQMVKLDVAGTPIDTITLKDSLSQSGALESAGGIAYISTLADGLPRVTNVDHYAGIVKDKSSLRRAIYAAQAIQESCFRGEDPTVVLSNAKDSFEKLAAQNSVSWNETTHAPKEYKENTAMQFSIEGFLQDSGATMIGGLSGHGKTLLMLSIAKALLAPPGTMLWGQFRVLEPASRVIYLIPESTLGPFAHRLKLFGIYEHALAHERFFSRTLSKGPMIPLDDRRMLAAAKGAHIFLDTAARFGEGDENSANDNNKGLAKDIFQLLAAGARAVICAHHAPKAFSRENVMLLENVLRGSGDVGAMLSTAWGVKQIDPHSNTIHVECVKSRDFQSCGPFQLQGRPHIDDTGDFQILRRPGECGSLADEHSPPRNVGGAPAQVRNERAANIALLRSYLVAEPTQTSDQLVKRFARDGVQVSSSTVRKYKMELEK